MAVDSQIRRTMILVLKRHNIVRRTFAQISYNPPDVSEIASKWRTLQPLLKEEIIEYLNWKMEDNWDKMSKNEMKAVYYISYGDWGPRSSSGTGQLPPSYLIWKSLFSGILFTALGVSVTNMIKDKRTNAKLQELGELRKPD